MQQVLETRAARGYGTPFGDCLAPCDIFHLLLKTINSSSDINCRGNYIYNYVKLGFLYLYNK